MESIAHIRQSDGKIQTVEEHLAGVKELAYRYGRKIEVGHLAGLAGWLHDMGKFSQAFKEYILEAVNNPDHPPKKGSVDHSTAGGKILFEEWHKFSQSVSEKMVAEMVGNAIISHHMGLQDFLTPDLDSDYLKRVRDKDIEDFDGIVETYFQNVVSQKSFQSFFKICENELIHFLKKHLGSQTALQPQFLLMFLTKFIFSCLIDADRTNTRCFEENMTPTIDTENNVLFHQYYQRLIHYLNKLNAADQSCTPINKLRAKMSQQCDHFADKPSGIYTLSIPTGGGKTLASLRYALKHAMTFNKDRIIYIVPYTTIIEQNAEEVKRILNDRENILEHHSNIIDDDKEDEATYIQDKLLKLAKDNWDAPIIYTTLVQFLNAFYSGGTRNVRRLHNLTNAVIIFDEIQSVPTKCLSLFNQALNFLKNVGKSSILLCTATQPALDFVKNKVESIDGEIVLNLENVYHAFKRVDIVDKTKKDGWNTEELSEFVETCFEKSSSILVILNTKTVVRNLYNLLKESQLTLNVFHLSTSMCAAHRKEVLDRVRISIKNGERVICLSTQLIEAGVDISFECVIRSLAGLDSIAQAAGRCNRHGEYGLRSVYIINHNEEKLDYLKEIKVGAQITRKMLKDRESEHGITEILSPDALRLYFKNFYHELENELNYYIPKLNKEMTDLLNENQLLKDGYKGKNGEPFPLIYGTSMKTAGNYFNVIDQSTTSVLVPYKDGEDIIAELNGDINIQDMNRLLKVAQQFSVNIYPHELNYLSKNGHLVYLRDGQILALSENAYDLDYGVNLVGEGRMETHFL